MVMPHMKCQQILFSAHVVMETKFLSLIAQVRTVLDFGFLSNRKQRVVLSGYFSKDEAVTSGVPQGVSSWTGTVFLYINDIGLCLKSTIRLYGDDALLHYPITNASSVEAFQKDLDSLERWAREWQMSFNTSKCFVMIFGSTSAVNILDLQYKLNNTVLQRVNSVKYLGVNITDNFNWGDHIVKKQSEAMQTLGMLKRNLHSAPTKVKLIAYKTLCRLRMEFAVEVWDPTANKYIQMLEMVQNKAARFVSNLKRRERVTNEKERLGLEPLQDRRKMQRIYTLHNIMGSKDTSLGELNDLINECFKEDGP